MRLHHFSLRVCLLRQTFDLFAFGPNYCPSDLCPPPPVFAAMEQLVSEVSVLLQMLDQESLSSSAEEKKTSVWNLLQQIQPPGEDVWVNKDRNSRFSRGFPCACVFFYFFFLFCSYQAVLLKFL